MNQTMPLNKLMILKMLDEVSFPLTNSQITEFLVKYNYMTYFEVQQTFSDLSATALIHEKEIHHSTQYTLTVEGEQTLSYYQHLIPNIFMEHMQCYLKENNIAFRNEASVVAGYVPMNDEYAVQCRVIEKDIAIFDMTLYAPTADLAEKMCFNWEKKHSEIYSHIFQELIEE